MSRMFQTSLIVIIVTAVSCTDAYGQWIPHATRTKRVCCISGRYDYSFNRLSNPVSAVTFAGTTETLSEGDIEAGTGASPVRLKTFPLRTASLKSDHCFLSKVVVTISSRGDWTLDCVAQQDSMQVDAQQRPRFQGFDQNKFHITLRPLTAESGSTPGSVDDVSVPAVASIAAEPFWMERGQIKQLHLEQSDRRLAARFDSIKTVAVDLQYE